jgi:hypothetical protein
MSKGDPLRCGPTHAARLKPNGRENAGLQSLPRTRRPSPEVNLAWQCYQQLRSIYHAGAERGRALCQKVLDSFSSCPIAEVARLGRTLRSWRSCCWPLRHHSPRLQRRHRSHQPDHRKSPPPRPRLQRLRPLPTPDNARRRRTTALPHGPEPCLDRRPALHPLWDVLLHYIGPGQAFTPWTYAIACISFDWLVAIYISSSPIDLA